MKIFNKETWYGRTFTILSILWLMLALAGRIGDDFLGPVIAFLSIIVFIWGGVWICRGCSKYQATNKIVHWLDLYINRAIDSIWFVLGSVVASFIIFCLAYGFDDAQNALIYTIWFESYCIITLIIGWVIAGKFIKQNLIVEANIKAKEMYEGKKRAIPYDNRK